MKHSPANLETCDLSTLLDRNPTLHHASFTPEQVDELLDTFNRYAVNNISQCQPEGSNGCLPCLDCGNVYVTDAAQEYFEFCGANVFQFLAYSTDIVIRHLTKNGKGWIAEWEYEKAHRKIVKRLGKLPAQVLPRVVIDKTTGMPFAIMLICVPAMESSPNL